MYLCSSEPVVKTPTVEIIRPLADVLKGDYAVLECSARDLPSGEVSVTILTNTGHQFPEVTYVDLPRGQSTLITRFTIPTTHQKKEHSFTCKVQQSPSKLWQSTSTGYIFAEPKPATLLLTTPTNAELETGNATFICAASQFSPNKFTFTWKLGDDVLSEKNRPEIVTEDKSTNTLTAVSILEIAASDWKYSYSPVKCEFKSSGSPQSKEAKYEAPSVGEIEVDIIPPSSEDMLVSGAGDLECKATGPDGFKGIRWFRN
uniref:Ig-like domain-containing protein n=1 Tax=Astyanax mexicanus TaxID=7994 RepID=A0A3B1J827_ASTMX